MGLEQQSGHSPKAVRRTGALPVIALVTAFIVPPLAVVLGIVGIRETNRTGDGGRGLAVAAVIFGTLTSLFWLLSIIMPEKIANLISVLLH